MRPLRDMLKSVPGLEVTSDDERRELHADFEQRMRAASQEAVDIINKRLRRVANNKTVYVSK